MPSTLQKQEDQTILLTITLPKDRVEKTRELVINEMVKQTELPGFRRGKAPRKLVEEKLDITKIQEDVLKKLLPEAYMEAVTEHKLQPIMNPKIHIAQLDSQKDWQFTATTCEMPEINLGDYKNKVQGVTAKSKIIIPGKEPVAPSFDDIVKALLDSVEVIIPSILIEGEVERLLAQLLEEIKRLGLSLDQYLSSTGKKIEEIKAENEKKAETDLKFELILQKIAENEKIVVEPQEVEEAIAKATTDAERKNLEANRYLLMNIIRQQKTLDFLRNL